MFIFAFVSFAFRRQTQNHVATIYVKECSACFFFQEFMVSSLTFRSLIHFELFFFVYGVRKSSYFILLHVAVQCSQYHRCTVLVTLSK